MEQIRAFQIVRSLGSWSGQTKAFDSFLRAKGEEGSKNRLFLRAH